MLQAFQFVPVDFLCVVETKLRSSMFRDFEGEEQHHHEKNGMKQVGSQRTSSVWEEVNY